jgi:HK97 family phage major capsid protein
VFVPLDLPVETRSGEVTKSAAAGAVPEIVSSQLIDILRNRMLMRQLGATILSDLTGGTFAIPKVTATGTAYHVTETTALTGKSSQTIGQVEFVPVKLGAYSEYSKDLLKQSSIDVEMWLRTDLATVIAVEFDRVGFNGSGSGAEPEGIMQNSSVNSVAIGVSGGDPTWAKIVELEKAVEVDNALAGSLAYVTSAAGRYKLKTTPRVANYPDYIWEMNEVNGYPAYSTNQIPADLTKSSGASLTAVIFGDFSAAMYGLWGGLDVVVNPYSLDTQGLIRVTLHQFYDFALRHEVAFAVMADMETD